MPTRASPKFFPKAITSNHLSMWRGESPFFRLPTSHVLPIDVSIVFCRALFGRVIGRGGKTINLIRRETDTNIQIPRREGDNIIISGQHRENVVLCRQRIEKIVLAASRPNHFNNVWINNDHIKSNYERFMVSFQN